jgi:hypothetical protein
MRAIRASYPGDRARDKDPDIFHVNLSDIKLAGRAGPRTTFAGHR